MGEKTVKETSETKVKPASLIDDLTGNSGPDGEKLEHGHPVTETEKTKTVEED